MTREVIDRLVRPANPVPDPKMLEADPESTIHEQRRNEMQQQQIGIDHAEEETNTNRGRHTLIGIAAAVALVIGAFALFQANEGTDIAAERTPVQIATDYLEAYRDFDVERVASMLAEDANVLPWESYAPRDWQSDLRFLEAAGFQILVSECTQPPTGGGLRVTCEYEAHGLGSEQIGLGPFSGHAFQLVIENGLVRSSAMGFDFSEFSQAMWWPFQNWINENHPEDFNVLYEDPTLSRQTEDAIAMWEQRVADYVEFKNSQP